MTSAAPADTAPVEAFELPAAGLSDLHAALTAAGYQVIGPQVTGSAITLGPLESAADLPFGVGVDVTPGGYRLRQRPDQAAFAHSAGPGSWKQFLHPPREKLWGAARQPDGQIVPDPPPPPPRPLAFLGVRSCDLHAIAVQDRVLGGAAHPGSAYAQRRASVLIVAVNCTEPGAACFCASMGTGPRAAAGYDLLLTEFADPGNHHFLAEAGSAAGTELMRLLPVRPAAADLARRASAELSAAAGQMGRAMQTDGLRDLLAASYDAVRWDDVAARCLTCGNCTMACPTCFCTDVSDISSLTGDHACRWQTWASCFDLDFTGMHGGPVRSSDRSRYRQWLTHKLGTWHDQFGESGCVGCGRCIVWCPAGIDLTEEVAALRAEHDLRTAAEAP